MNLRRRFTIFSILCGIIPVVISTIMCITVFNAKSTEMIKQNVTTAANDQSINLEDFFKQNISELNVAGNMPITRELLMDSNNKISSEKTAYKTKILNELLGSRKKQQYFLKDVALLNKNGTVVADSNTDYINKSVTFYDEDLEKLSRNQVIVTNIIQDKNINNGIKSAVIASPVWFENQYEGCMISIIDMSYFENLLRNVHFFKTGKVAIMDKNGVIAASSSENISKNINEINTKNDLYEKWKKIDVNINPKGIIEYTLNGIDKIGYYSTIDNTGWVVLSGVQWDEFKYPLYEKLQSITIFLIILLLLVIVSYIFIINYFSKPIYKFLGVIRKVNQGNYKGRFLYSKDNEFREIAVAFNDLIDNIEKKKKQIEDKNRDLRSLTSNIPGGVHRNIIENEEHILDFLSAGCLNLLGYEEHEFNQLFGKRIFDVIYEKDRERVEKEIKEQIRKYNKFKVEYRIKRKDGSLIWLIDNGRIVKDTDGRTFSYSVVVNITDTKIAEEELRLSEERYRIIMSQTEDIIFEWDVEKDTISFSDKWIGKFDNAPIIIDVSKKINNKDSIYKDDLGKLSELLNSIIRGEKYRETELRIKKNNNEYIWCRIRMTAMFDENGNVFKAIGAIIDIDKYKKETEKLLFKAERDSATGLYNKGTVQRIIEEYMQKEELNAKGALFVIDVDNFKSINDNLGHLVGDFVLTNISSMLSEVFNENSIIGRIGGDEFIVFLKGVNSKEFIHQKAEDLVEGFMKIHTEVDCNYKVSGSIGIANYPKHGSCFKQLFISADKALYFAKKKGKDNYCVFEEI